MLPFTLGADTLAAGQDVEEEAEAAAVGTGGWWSLGAVVAAARSAAEAEARSDPVACPNDFQALVTGPDGRLFCPWDGWRPR